MSGSSMMWRGLEEIERECGQPGLEGLLKVCALERDSDLIALGQDNCLYHATLDNSSTILHFHKVADVTAVDIATSNKQVLYVDIQGQVFQCEPKSWESRNQVLLKEESKNCSHGHQTPSRTVKIKSITGGEFGVLYVSSSGQLWASGCMPQIGVNSVEPRNVTYFQGRTVYRAAVGDNFAMAVVRKKICDDETDSDNDEDVFAVECLECQAMSRVSTPTSQPSQQDTCPLGVKVSRSSEDTCTHSADNREDTSPSTEDSELAKIHFDSKQDNTSNKKSHCEKTELILEPIEEDNQIDFPKKPNGDDKPNMIFINTEAAKQFLTKQLSWVSAGEDYLAECTEKPTRIIKENVSSLTNLVVESVKTVGDKVATLSRHMSGGSETNDGQDLHLVEELNPLIYSLTSSYKLDDIQISSSTVSEKDNTHNLVIERAKVMVKIGQNLINSEVWVWGEENKGQLGTGDLIKRSTPNSVAKLSNIGVYKICCGKSHCAAVTLDGRLFCWGHNDMHQVSVDSYDDKSSPVQFTANSNTDRVWDVACGDTHTLVFTLDSNMFYLGKHLSSHTNSIVNLKDKISNESTFQCNYKKSKHKSRYLKKSTDFFNTLSNDLNFNSRVLSSGMISVYHSYPHNDRESPALQDLAIEQQFLEEMLLVHQYLIKPLLKKIPLMASNSDTYDNLCSTYADIMYFTAVNVLSLWNYTEGNKRAIEIAIIQNSDEHISLYEKYVHAVCNVIAVNGFNQMSLLVDVPVVVQNLFADKIPSSKQKNIKTVSESIISCAIMHPLSRLNTYKCMVQSFIRYNVAMSPMEIKSFIEQRLQDVVSKLDSFNEFQDKRNKEANATKIFWESAGKNMEGFRLPERRLLRDSKTNSLSLLHSGRFSSHWYILLNDILIHINGSHQITHPLTTLWVEPVADTDSVQNAIHVITPEESFTLITPNCEERNDWLIALQNAIKISLNKLGTTQPPLIRTATYSYTNKSQFYKEAKYVGRWCNGKLHGAGKVEWSDGKNYLGQFHNNQIHGQGRMEIPNIGVYEGHWKENLQNGFGVMKYCSGDLYEGYFKDGLAHGHGVRKQGDFTSSTATIYMGEWSQGVKQGYGVMDDIGKGEKYLGSWSDNKKNGCGLIVTLDGIYYEGVFMNDTLTGHGVMVFEDGTHYEGEFRSAGVFSGKGTLTFSSGDRIEGTLSGAWTDGVKISGGVLHMNVSNPALPPNAKPNSFGKLCVPPNQKWNGLFRHCFQQLGVPDNLLTQTGDQTLSKHPPNTFTKKIWQNVAVLLSNAQKESSSSSLTSGLIRTPKKSPSKAANGCELLDVIPQFGQTTLTIDSFAEIKQYLCKACEMSYHPIGQLVAGCAAAFSASYGGVRVHPLLLSHAVVELGCISSRIYSAVRLLFPALPLSEEYVILKKNTDDEDDLENSEVISVSSVVQPLLLPRVHPSLHVLYALHHQKEDVAYWKRLLKWNRQTDVTLMAFLGIDQKFWVSYAARTGVGTPPFSPVKDQLFSEAVETLQHIKTTFSPMEKLLVIKNTFQQMTTSVQKELGSTYLWTMDELFPVFHFVVVRARILQLGSEIHFIEDFLEPCMQNGELGIMFTTLKACYYQILQEKITICD